jgi:polyisoprenoid-binding protein YceI
MTDMSNNTTQPGSPTAIALAEVTPGAWTLDPAASVVAFEHKTIWGLVTVKGVFAQVDGEAEVPAEGTAHGSVTVGAASIDTKHKKRDIHLRSADFFDVEAHPAIVFTASGVTPTGRDTVDVTGELTVRGVSRPLAFSARATEASNDAVTLTAAVAVDRADYGITWNQLGMLKGQAALALTLRFTRKG